MEEGTFTDAHGVEVFTRRWSHPDPKAVVVISHGMSEHSGRYERFAGALEAAGYGAAALDHRGHGRTGEVTGAGHTGPGGGDAILEDLHELVTRVQAEHPGVPVVVFGHSMGSMIVQAYVTRYDDGLAGFALSGWPGATEGAAELAAGLDAAVEAGMGDDVIDLLGGFNDAFEPLRTQSDWLSRDEAEVDAYVADPYCGDDNPMTYGFVRDLLAVSAASVVPDAIAKIASVPVLMIAGEMDPAGAMGANPRALEERLRDAGLDVTAHYYPEARHEVLNEINRDEVTADVVAWLDGIVG